MDQGYRQSIRLQSDIPLPLSIDGHPIFNHRSPLTPIGMSQPILLHPGDRRQSSHDTRSRHQARCVWKAILEIAVQLARSHHHDLLFDHRDGDILSRL